MTDFDERLVLRESFTSDDMDFVSMQRGWVLRQARMPEAGAFVDVWVTLDGRAEIHLVDDEPIGVRYVTVRGPGSSEVSDQVRSDCALWTTTEALQALTAASDSPGTITAGYVAALSATPDEADAVAQALLPLAEHPDPAVRRAFVVAAAYFSHPTLVERISRLASSESADQVRTDAQLVLEGLAQEQ
ncbi:hypothetical protein ACWGID_11505 [Kribbella sp. NPDC054772]